MIIFFAGNFVSWIMVGVIANPMNFRTSADAAATAP